MTRTKARPSAREQRLTRENGVLRRDMRIAAERIADLSLLVTRIVNREGIPDAEDIAQLVRAVRGMGSDEDAVRRCLAALRVRAEEIREALSGKPTF